MINIPPPVIVAGMHASGTTLLSRIVQRCGVFMGAEKNENEEAEFFRGINQQVLALTEASWDEPETFVLALGQRATRLELEGLLKRAVNSVRTVRY